MGLDYTPPNGDNIGFELPGSYTVPDGDDIKIWMAYDQSSVVRKLLVQQYSLRTGVSLAQPYNIYAFHFIAAVSQIYGLRMSINLIQRYEDTPTLTSWLNQWYGDAGQLRAYLEQPYEDAYRFIVPLKQPYILPELLTKTLEQRYAISSTEFLSLLTQHYNLSSYNSVLKSLLQPFSLLDDGVDVITPPPIDGVIISPPSGP